MGKLSALVIALTITGIHPAFSAETDNNKAENNKAFVFGNSDKTMKSLLSDGFNIAAYDYMRYYDRNQTKVTSREAYILQKDDDAYKCVLVAIYSLHLQSGREMQDSINISCFHLE